MIIDRDKMKAYGLFPTETALLNQFLKLKLKLKSTHYPLMEVG
jgi:hypothetical protein